MQEDKIYITPDGTEHKVLMYDEINKIVYINIIANKHRWVHENEYSTWHLKEEKEMPKIYIPDVPAQMMEEQVEDIVEKVEVEEKPKKKTVKK